MVLNRSSRPLARNAGARTVAPMSRFRDSAFLTWALVLLVMAALAMTAVGRDSTSADVPKLGSSAPIVRGAAHSGAAVQVEQLRDLVSYGIAAGSDADALTAWADRVEKAAGAGFAVRQAEGAGEDDVLAASLQAMATEASRLRDVATDPVASASSRTRILLLLDQATNAAAGRPAVTLPNPGGDVSNSTSPTMPDAPAPAQPTVNSPSKKETR